MEEGKQADDTRIQLNDIRIEDAAEELTELKEDASVAVNIQEDKQISRFRKFL